jgi:hypothetical protein
VRFTVTVEPAEGGACATGSLSRARLVAVGSRDEAPMPDTSEEPSFVFPEDHKAVVPDPSIRGTTHVVSDLMSTPERAVQDAEKKLERALTGWLVPDVPTDWTPPRGLIEKVILSEPTIREVKREYATVHQAALEVDLSSTQRAVFLKAYQREQGLQRLGWLGAVLTFVLALLGILSGYIRADEATKGYYTNRLRLLAAAGVGAAGVVLYRVLT